MPRTFALKAESPASVEQFHAAFTDESYWRARVAAGDSGPGTSSLDEFVIDRDGNVSVAMTVTLLRAGLPNLVEQLSRGELRMVHNESWTLAGQDSLHGQLKAALAGVPLTALGAAVFERLANGSQLTFTATVEVKVPLIGGMVESFIGNQLADAFLALQDFTTEWIAENG